MRRALGGRLGRLGSAVILAMAAPFPAMADLGADDLAEVERLLAALNFDPGPIDGVVDDRTRTAIRLYQEFAALTPDGEPTDALLTELRAVVEVFGQMKAAQADAKPVASTEPEPPLAEEPDRPVSESEPEAAPPAPADAPVPEAMEASVPEAAPDDATANVSDEAVLAAISDDVPSEDAAPVLESDPEIPETTERDEPAPVDALEQTTAAPEPAADVEPEPEPEPNVPDASPEAPQEAAETTEAVTDTAAPVPAATDAADEESAAPPVAEESTGPPVPQERPPTPEGFDLNKVIARLVEKDDGDGDAPAEPASEQAAEDAQQPETPAAEQTAAVPPQPEAAATANAASDLSGYDAFKQGFVAARDGDLDQAIVYYSGAIESGDLTLEDIAAVLYNRANAYHYKGLFDQAIADYDAALSNKPNFPAAHYNRGFAFAAKGLRTRAVEDYQKARALGLQRLGVRSPDLAPPFQ